MSADLEGLLAEVAHGNTEGSGVAMAKLSDWLIDHPGRASEVLAMLLRDLPSVMRAVIARSLQIEVTTHRIPVGQNDDGEGNGGVVSHYAVAGLTITVWWDGMRIQDRHVDLM